MRQTQFKVEGYKRIICPNCGSVRGEMYLKEKNIRYIKCKKCKAEFNYFPPHSPTVIQKNVVKKIQYGPGDAICSEAPPENFLT